MSDLTEKIRKNLQRYPSDDPNDFTNVDEIVALLDEMEDLEEKIDHMRQTMSPRGYGVGE